MFIPVLKGYKEILEKVKDGEIISKACPECQHDLVLKQLRKWSTIFMIPYVPGNETRFVYECAECRQFFDVAYRKTFINRARFRNAGPREVKELTDSFSVIIFASLMGNGDRPIDEKIDVLKDFAIARRIDLEANAEKFEDSFLSRNDLTAEVFEWFDIFRDSFESDYRAKALQQVLNFSKTFSLADKEIKLLYTYCRHWGFTKNQFDEMFSK
jgi:hypothetical protein